MPTTGPVIEQLPTAPNRGMSSSTYPIIADAWAAKIGPWTTQVNAVTTWMGQKVDLILAAQDAANQDASDSEASAVRAEQQVELAADQVELAVTARQGAETAQASTAALAAAVAAGALPPFVDGLDVLQAKSDKTGVQWGKVGQAVGDVLETIRTPDSTYVLPDTVYTRAAYPALFALVGTQGEKNDWASFSQVVVGFNANYQINDCASGLNSVVVAVGASAQNSTSTNGAAFKSTDGGNTWAPLPALTGVEALQTITTDGSGVWIATARLTAGLYYRSNDNGVTWSALNGMANGVNSWQSSTLSIDTDRAGIWLATCSGTAASAIARSTDNGLTWNPVSTSGTASMTSVSWDSGGGGVWYAAATNSMYRTENNGTTFFLMYYNNQYGPLIPVSGGGVTAMALNSPGLAVSTDKGLNWKTFNVPYATNIQVDPLGTIFFQASGKLYKSYDKGETWTTSFISQVYVAPFRKTIDASGSMLAIGAGAVLPTTGNFWKAARGYNYDVATQFKTPPHKAPKGFKAYIKGKLL